MGSVGNPRPSLGNLPLLLLPLLCSCFTEHVQTKQLHDAAKGGPWDAHAALAAHKRHRRTVQAKESSAGSKLASLLGKTQDLFVDRHYRDAATGWLEAQKHCQAEGRRLCRIDEYCGAATHPVRETVHGDHWAPVADERGQYIAIGDMFPDRVCRTHSHCCGGLPSWGMEGMAGLLSLCCGKADKLAQKAFLGTIERRAHKMLTSEITHDEARVLKRLRYWLPQAGAKHGHKRLTANELQAAFPTAEGKYLSFEVDGGGFNNIRIAFEFMVMLSVITGRTLVLPPARGWYLIDWGGMGKKLAADQKKGGHLREFVDTGHLSTFADFFDTKDMCGVTRCVTAEEFVQREGAALGVPQRFRGPEGAAHLKGGKNGDPFPWEDWLRLHSRWGSFNPLAQVLYWPSKPAVASAGREPDSTWVVWREAALRLDATVAHPHLVYPCFSLRDGRQAVGMPKEESEAKLLHFPHCTAYNKGVSWPSGRACSGFAASSLNTRCRGLLHRLECVFCQTGRNPQVAAEGSPRLSIPCVSGEIPKVAWT